MGSAEAMRLALMAKLMGRSEESVAPRSYQDIPKLAQAYGTPQQAPFRGQGNQHVAILPQRQKSSDAAALIAGIGGGLRNMVSGYETGQRRKRARADDKRINDLVEQVLRSTGGV
jgi:hypothetical protein